MTWEGFWLPNIIQATVFATLAALVGVLVRRWLKDLRPLLTQILGLQDSIASATDDASAQATVAAVESRRAAESAGAATARATGAEELSRQANEAVVWLAEQLAVRDAVNEQLRERIDRLLGTRARQLATEHHAPTTAVGLLVPAAAGTEDDPMTVTGRHRLHTTAVPTAPEGDHP